jgi:hypothetical protein
MGGHVGRMEEGRRRQGRTVAPGRRVEIKEL